jgi:hypothetical protein
MIKNNKYIGKNSSYKMTLWLQDWQAGQFFPITFLVILFMPIFIWSPQTKGHILRLKLSNDPSSAIEALFSVHQLLYYSLRFSRAHLLVSEHIQTQGKCQSKSGKTLFPLLKIPKRASETSPPKIG